MLKQFLLLTITALVTGCGYQAKSLVPDSQASKQALLSPKKLEGKRYIDALVKEIDNSDHIVVTEHSFELDAYDYDRNKSFIPTPIVYASKVLSPDEVSRFRSIISSLDPTTQDAFTACAIEPHHTITFYHANKESSVMDICFICGRVEWKGTNDTPPWSLYGGLDKFISAIGMHTEQDWPALAKAHLGKSHRPN